MMPPDFTPRLRQLLLRCLEDPFGELSLLGLAVFMMLAANFLLEYVELPLPLVILSMCAALGAVILTERGATLLPRLFSWTLSTFILFNQVIGLSHTSHKLATMDRQSLKKHAALLVGAGEAHAQAAPPPAWRPASGAGQIQPPPAPPGPFGRATPGRPPPPPNDSRPGNPPPRGFFKTW